MRTSLCLVALGSLGGPHAVAAQAKDPLPGPATVVAAIEQDDVPALVKMFGARVELTDPSFSGLKGYLEMQRVVDNLKGCSASHNGEDGQKVYSFIVTYDCPRPDGFKIGADCATEDFKLWVTRRLASEAVRPGMTSHVAVLAPYRSNEGECYRPPVAPPASPAVPRPAKTSDK